MSKVMNSIKLLSSSVCPNCNEKYSFYISPNGTKKGILPGECVFEHSLVFTIGKHMTVIHVVIIGS